MPCCLRHKYYNLYYEESISRTFLSSYQARFNFLHYMRLYFRVVIAPTRVEAIWFFEGDVTESLDAIKRLTSAILLDSTIDNESTHSGAARRRCLVYCQKFGERKTVFNFIAILSVEDEIDLMSMSMSMTMSARGYFMVQYPSLIYLASELGSRIYFSIFRLKLASLPGSRRADPSGAEAQQLELPALCMLFFSSRQQLHPASKSGSYISRSKLHICGQGSAKLVAVQHVLRYVAVIDFLGNSWRGDAANSCNMVPESSLHLSIWEDGCTGPSCDASPNLCLVVFGILWSEQGRLVAESLGSLRDYIGRGPWCSRHTLLSFCVDLVACNYDFSAQIAVTASSIFASAAAQTFQRLGACPSKLFLTQLTVGSQLTLSSSWLCFPTRSDRLLSWSIFRHQTWGRSKHESKQASA